MSKIRVYLPTTLTLLRGDVAAGGLGPSPLRARAVTEELRAAYPDLGDEDWEYTAMSAAAQDALGLLTDDDPPRRVVLAADVDSVLPGDRPEDGGVEVATAVPLRALAAVHVDTPEAEADVAAARAVWARAQDEDAEAVAAVERCLDHELAWFATQEIGDLLDL